MVQRKVALALQGGGSHGAFTWGVLDRLLEDESIDLIGVTGTSAGAMNAVVLADGLVQGDRALARRKLRQFWEKIGAMPGFASLLGPLSGEAAAQLRLEYTPAFLWWDAISRNLSPYDLNPLKFNPLQAPLAELVDFEALRKQDKIKVFIGATNVRTARRKVFTGTEVTLDSVLASACLPNLFPAVEIDGEAYWDGGYTGNPAIVALTRTLPECDLILVRVDPITHEKPPRSVREIDDRVREIGFNSTFWLEMSGLAMIQKMAEEGHLVRTRFGNVHFHAIEASSDMERLPSSSKLNTHKAFLEHLFELGRRTAESWAAKNAESLGVKSTFDLKPFLPTGF